MMNTEDCRSSTDKYKTAGVFWLVIVLLSFIKKLRYRLRNEQKASAKYNELYKLMVQWMEIKQSGQSISEWLKENGYYEIAIYGLYLIGERLYVELLDENVEVVYGIDRKSRDSLEGLRMYKPNEELPHADLVIVTAVSDFEEIKKELQGKTGGPVISLKEVMDEAAIR